MKLNVLLVGLSLFLFAASLIGKEAWLPKSAGPPACFAGEPPRSSTCHNSGCHTDFAVNSGNATLMLNLDGAENGYALGQLYKVKVSLTQPGILRGGFQAIALQDNNDTISPGTFTLTDLLRTQRIDRNLQHADTGCAIHSKVWIEHTEYGIDDPIQDTISWEFDWRAPSSDVGGITFFAAAVESNVDLDASGDHVYSISKSISALPTSTTPMFAQEPFLLFPNPVSDRLEIRTVGIQPYPTDQVSIYDMTGRRLLKTPLTTTVEVSDLQSGIYLVKITLGEGTWTRKFVKE